MSEKTSYEINRAAGIFKFYWHVQLSVNKTVNKWLVDIEQKGATDGALWCA